MQLTEKMVTIYRAYDGTEFTNRDLCEAHEEALNTTSFDERLLSDDRFHVDDFGCNVLMTFSQFRLFCQDNRDFVLQHCLGMDTNALLA